MNQYEVTNNLQNLQFEIDLEGEKAFLEYRWLKDDLALMHTLVPENFEGKGIAGLLAKTALEFAKDKAKKVIVYCPYVKSFIKRNPEYEAFIKHT